MTQNSRYFSAHCSPRLQNRILPHITIQCPVYKEGLHSVIVPTVRSIKQAISTYELQGGSANMFINDDGLQIISEEDRRQRIEFYADNCIGWTARPKHGANGFNRRGKFKKVCPVVQSSQWSSLPQNPLFKKGRIWLAFRFFMSLFNRQTRLHLKRRPRT